MNDDRNAASGSCARMPSIVGEEPVAAPPPLHASQQRGVGVLQREVEVGHDGRQLEHRRDQRVAHLARVEVEQPDARQAVGRERVEPAEQRRERAGLADVAPVPREVLRDEHELGDAAARRGSRASASIDSGVRERCLPRNDGIAQNAQARSQPSATFRYAHGTVGAGRGQLEQVAHAGRLRGRRRAERRPTVAERALAREADDRVDLGQRGRELVAVALGHAAGDDELGPGLAGVAEGEDGVDRLLARRLDERARVDDDEVGVVGAVGGHQAVGQEARDDLVGVDGVLRAAERLDVEGALAAWSLTAPQDTCGAGRSAVACSAPAPAIWARRSAPSTSSTSVSFTWRRLRASHSTTGTLAGTESASRTSRGWWRYTPLNRFTATTNGMPRCSK